MLIKYSFFTKASAVLAVSTALLFAVPAFAQTPDSEIKISFFERLGSFFSARKERRLEKLKEFVSETVTEEPISTPLNSMFEEEVFPVLPLVGEEKPLVMPLPEVQSAPFESQKLAPMEQESLFKVLSQ